MADGFKTRFGIGGKERPDQEDTPAPDDETGMVSSGTELLAAGRADLTEMLDTERVGTDVLPTELVSSTDVIPTSRVNQFSSVGLKDNQSNQNNQGILEDFDPFAETGKAPPISPSFGQPAAKTDDGPALFRRSPRFVPTDKVAPKPADTYLEEDSDYDEDEDFSETSVAPILATDVSATALGSAIDGRFRLEGVLGEGGMGKVYRGIQLSIGRPVAIKVIKKDILNVAIIRERFLREAKVISGFTHPNVVRLIDFGETKGGQLFLALEFVNGRPLSELFAGRQVHPRYVLELGRQVSAALIEAHSQGIVHRDLKPDNLLLTRIADGSFQFKVLDFGVARTSASTLTKKGSVCGTPGFMAPEQARGLDITPATDLYALGVLMFELLTGQPPFRNPDPFKLMLDHCQLPAPHIHEFAPHVPDEVCEVIAALLEKDPNNRITSSLQLSETLEHIKAINGWSGTMRLPAGPLLTTTQTWFWDELRDGGSPPDEEDEPKSQSNDWLSKPSDFAASAGDSKAPQTGFQALSNDAPIELDLPEPRERAPIPQPVYVAPDPTPTADLLPSPASRQSHAAPDNTQTQSRPAPARRNSSAGKSSSSGANQSLILALAGLIVIAGGLAAYMFILRPNQKRVNLADSSIQNAQGVASNVFNTLATSGWKVSNVTEPYGEMNVQSGTIQRDEVQVKVIVYQATDAGLTQQLFDDVLLPNMAFLSSKGVIMFEPGNALATNEDLKAAMFEMMKVDAGGKMSQTGI